MKLKRYLPAIMVGLLFSACEKDYHYLAPVLNPNVPIDYDIQIQPILTVSCAKANCHDGSSNDPSLIPADSYQALFAMPDIDTSRTNGVIDPNNSILYQRLISPLQNKIMPKPPVSPLPQDQIDLIKNWIIQGAKNN